jgi:hypothetical protein
VVRHTGHRMDETYMRVGVAIDCHSLAVGFSVARDITMLRLRSIPIPCAAASRRRQRSMQR